MTQEHSQQPKIPQEQPQQPTAPQQQLKKTINNTQVKRCGPYTAVYGGNTDNRIHRSGYHHNNQQKLIQQRKRYLLEDFERI